jgi:tetratricopeptide (TPR) repeat protein
MISSNRADMEDIAAAMVLLAKVASKQAKFDEAIYLFHESLSIFREMGIYPRAAKALVDLGWAYYAQPNLEAAYTTFVEALQTAYDAKFVPITIDALFGLATLLITNQPLDTVLALVLHVVQHPSTEQATHHRSQQLQADIERQLSEEQVAAVRTAVEKQTFEAVVASVLQAASARQLLDIRLQ